MTLVVFDIDGTLTDTKAIDDRCYLNSLKECWSCDLKNVDWSIYKNVTDAGLAKEIFFNLFEEELKEQDLHKLKEVFVAKIIKEADNNRSAFAEIRGAFDFIKALQAEAVAIAFATGGWKTSAGHKLKKIGIDLNLFPHATSDDHYTRKDILTHAIQRAKRFYGKDFSKIIYVGDGVWDYEVAGLLNIDFIGVDHLQIGRLKQCGATKVYKDFTDIASIFKNILTA